MVTINDIQIHFKQKRDGYAEMPYNSFKSLSTDMEENRDKTARFLVISQNRDKSA